MVSVKTFEEVHHCGQCIYYVLLESGRYDCCWPGFGDYFDDSENRPCDEDRGGRNIDKEKYSKISPLDTGGL